ncbi:endonuclease/exonuclease/phosphatase family protein [Sorangium sp. So ce269]
MVFTWNLNESPDALDLACKHLAQQGSFIAAFQELPDLTGLDSRWTSILGRNKFRLLSQEGLKFAQNHQIRAKHYKVLLLASDDIEIDLLGKRHAYNAIFAEERRLEGITLRSSSGKGVQVLGVHAWDRKSRPHEVQRTEWAAIMRDALDAFWNGGPLIVVGDLNAHPWSAEITGRHGLYAIRRKDWPENGSSKRANREKYVTPLYNPMWQLLPDSTTGGQGTLFYPDHLDLHWHGFDHIIVSDDLRDKCGTPAVLTRLVDRDLVDEKGIPTKRTVNGKRLPELSDHLPVQMTINL